MVRAPTTLQQRCQNYRVSDKRYQSESAALIDAGFSQNQANRLILRPYSRNIVATVLESHSILRTTPYNLSYAQIIKIASHSGGGVTIKQIIQSYPNLIDLGLNQQQIVKIAAHSGGKKAIEQVVLSYNTLIDLGYNQEQIIQTACNRRGGHAIEQFMSSYHRTRQLIENNHNSNSLPEQVLNQDATEQHASETIEHIHLAESIPNHMNNIDEAQSNIDSLLQEFLVDAFMNDEIADNNIHNHESEWENTSISSSFSIFSNNRNYPKEKENHSPEKRQRI